MKTFSVSSAAKECNTSRPTLMRAINSGKLPATFEESSGQWSIRLDNLLAAGFTPHTPMPKPHETTHSSREHTKELEHRIELLQFQLAAAQKLNYDYTQTISDLRTIITDYRRMLPAPPTKTLNDSEATPLVSRSAWWKFW